MSVNSILSLLNKLYDIMRVSDGHNIILFNKFSKLSNVFTLIQFLFITTNIRTVYSENTLFVNDAPIVKSYYLA
jgi:hypothetical protein